MAFRLPSFLGVACPRPHFGVARFERRVVAQRERDPTRGQVAAGRGVLVCVWSRGIATADPPRGCG